MPTKKTAKKPGTRATLPVLENMLGTFLGGTGKRKRQRVKVQAPKPEPTAPTAEDDVIAELTRQAVVGKQRLPGKRRRRKSSQRDRLQKAIAKREREIGTLKRALALLDASTTTRKPKRASLLTMAMDLQRP